MFSTFDLIGTLATVLIALIAIAVKIALVVDWKGYRRHDRAAQHPDLGSARVSVDSVGRQPTPDQTTEGVQAR